MHFRNWRVLLLGLILSLGVQANQDSPKAYESIAFGSCLRQWQPQKVWQSIESLAPSAFIFLGDTVYTDRGPYEKLPEPERIELAYRDLANTEEFNRFRRTVTAKGIPLYATWDDHDYGVNDGGAEYPFKLESKKYFLDFFGLDQTASGDEHNSGVYQSHFLTLANKQVQLILLDTRSFRSPLNKSDEKNLCPPTGILPNDEPGATLLGESQWLWLENELRKPADLRILASSIQVVPEQHCFEKWANFPTDRMRLFDLIKTTHAEHLIILSGDRHLGEISRLPPDQLGYPLYEITASGLNSAISRFMPVEDNRYRLEKDNVRANHFGLIAIKETDNGNILLLQLRDERGEIRQETEVPFDELRFKEN